MLHPRQPLALGTLLLAALALLGLRLTQLQPQWHR
jgi:hypothetical protein